MTAENLIPTYISTYWRDMTTQVEDEDLCQHIYPCVRCYLGFYNAVSWLLGQFNLNHTLEIVRKGKILISVLRRVST